MKNVNGVYAPKATAVPAAPIPQTSIPLPAGHAGCARPVQRRCYGWPDNLSQQDKAPI